MAPTSVNCFLCIVLTCSFWQTSNEHAIKDSTNILYHGEVDTNHHVRKRQVDENPLEARVLQLEERLETISGGETGATGPTGPRGKDVGSNSNIVKYVKLRVSDLEEALAEEERAREMEVNQLKGEVNELKAIVEEFNPVFNPCNLENGGCSHICVFGDGLRTCSCPGGFTLNNDGVTCDDINECSSDDQPCYFECVNTVGSLECRCPTGYNLQDDKITCEDVDECATQNGYCSDICTNTEGSFECSCEPGSILSDDRLNCIPT